MTPALPQEPTRGDLLTALRWMVREAEAAHWPLSADQAAAIDNARRLLAEQDATDATVIGKGGAR